MQNRVVKPVAAHLLLAIAVCFLAFQWLNTAMAADPPATNVADSHAPAGSATHEGPCDATQGNCSAAHLCSCAVLAGPPVRSTVSGSTGRLPEARLLFADHLPGQTLPPPLAVRT